MGRRIVSPSCCCGEDVGCVDGACNFGDNRPDEWAITFVSGSLSDEFGCDQCSSVIGQTYIISTGERLCRWTDDFNLDNCDDCAFRITLRLDFGFIFGWAYYLTIDFIGQDSITYSSLSARNEDCRASPPFTDGVLLFPNRSFNPLVFTCCGLLPSLGDFQAVPL